MNEGSLYLGELPNQDQKDAQCIRELENLVRSNLITTGKLAAGVSLSASTLLSNVGATVTGSNAMTGKMTYPDIESNLLYIELLEKYEDKKELAENLKFTMEILKEENLRLKAEIEKHNAIKVEAKIRNAVEAVHAQSDAELAEHIMDNTPSYSGPTNAARKAASASDALTVENMANILRNTELKDWTDVLRTDAMWGRSYMMRADWEE